MPINISQVNNLGKIINRIDTIMKKEAYDKIGFSLFIWLLIFPFTVIGILMLLGVYPSNFINDSVSTREVANNLLSTIYMYYIILPLILTPISILGIKKYLNQKNISLKKTLFHLDNEKGNIDNIESVLKKFSIIQVIIESLLLKKLYIRFFLGKKVYENYRELISNLFLYLNQIMYDLKNDLCIRLAEHNKILIESKVDLDKIESNHANLIEVTNLQEKRLDRQIEQFEELQKVLVKL